MKEKSKVKNQKSKIQIKIQKLKNYYHLLKAVFWAYWCGYPAKKLYVVGVTGTDGKTTTCTLIYEMLRKAGGGIKPALLSTVSAKIGNPSASLPAGRQGSGQAENIETGLHTTNPGPELLQPLLKKMADNGVTHVVLEVTSHGLDQNRVWGCNFQIGVLTNISHEHLDYHGTMDKYRETKAKLFRDVRYAVLNKDDDSYEYLKYKCKSKCKIISYTKTKIKQISPALAGEYNLYNIGAAEAVAKIIRIQDNKIKRIVKEFAGVPGRREEVRAGQNFKVFVDFAHTPNALESVLKSLRVEIYHPSKHRLILVFGCTGERDKEKRPVMGGIAAKLADIVIITSDDTRGESQDEICSQIEYGISNIEYRRKHKTLFKENDRRRAIELAVKMAKEGDIVLLAGKGHEKSILHGTTEYPWSDVTEAERAIKFLH